MIILEIPMQLKYQFNNSWNLTSSNLIFRQFFIYVLCRLTVICLVLRWNYISLIIIVASDVITRTTMGCCLSGQSRNQSTTCQELNAMEPGDSYDIGSPSVTRFKLKSRRKSFIQAIFFICKIKEKLFWLTWKLWVKGVSRDLSWISVPRDKLYRNSPQDALYPVFKLPLEHTFQAMWS